MSGSRLLVTGSRGYLGGRILRDLEGAHALIGDVTARETLLQAVAQAPPAAAIVHLAGLDETACAAEPLKAFAVNSLGAGHVMEAAAAASIPRVVLLSTFHVYGPVADGATITEQRVPSPRHPYGISKLAGEHLGRAVADRLGLEVAIVRLSNAVGAPADAGIARWSLVALDLCRQAHERQQLTLRSSGVQRRDFVTIADVARVVRALCDAPAETLRDPVFNVGSGRTLSIRELATIVSEEYGALYGRAIEIAAPPHDGAPPASFTFDTTRLRALGVRPSGDMRPAIRETLQFCERFAS